jgi:ABC-2 type transport system ATP-binding protein
MAAPAIETKDLAKTYAGGVRALADLDLRVEPGDLRLFDRLTAREQLDSLARLRGGVDAQLQDALCERFGVVLDRPIRQLSKGNRQKIGVVQAFMHRPELVILDERSRPAAPG